jgi:hypothetical protein
VSGPNPKLPSDPVERQTLIDAVRKASAGAKLTQAERRAYDRHKRSQEEAARWAYYATIPKGHWVKMAGRQHRDLDRLAGVYGVPLLGATINLAAVVTWLHKFLAENGHKLNQPETPDELLAGESTPALERLREETWRIRRYERLQLEDQLVNREVMHTLLAQLAALIRDATVQLEKAHGRDAAEILSGTLDSYSQLVERFFSQETESSEPCPEPDPVAPDPEPKRQRKRPA